MNKDWNDFMKLGIVHFMAFPDTIKGEGAISETVQKIADDGFFDVIEITWIKDEKTRQEVRDFLRNKEMVVGFGVQPPLLINKLNLNSADEHERRRAIDQVKACIDQAIFMGAKGAGVLSGPDPGGRKRDEEKKLLIDSLKEICAYSQASTKDLLILLENFDRDIDKKCLIGPTEEAAEIAEEIRRDFANFGLMIDLSHLPLLKEEADFAVRKASPYLKHIHIGNCVMKDSKHPAYGDQHPAFGVEGGENGVSELTEFLKVLKEVGYIRRGATNIVSFEVKPYGNQTSEEVINISKEVFSSSWNNIEG